MKFNKLKIFLISILGLIVLIIGIFFLYMRWSFRVEVYCQKKALDAIGGENNWGKLVDAQPSEYPYIGGKGGQITTGFREQLKCEHDPETLKKFQGWF